MTAFEYATTFSIFDCVRNPNLESKLVNMVEFIEQNDNKPLINLDVDTCDAFNYETAKDGKYSVDDLRNILITEIILVK
jgi:hypothetical protein